MSGNTEGALRPFAFSVAAADLSRPLLAAGQMAREIASSLISRPISFGNATYVKECLESLAAIRDEVLRLTVFDRRSDLVRDLVDLLEDLLRKPSPVAFEQSVAVLDRLLEAHLYFPVQPYGMVPAGLLSGKAYRRVIAMIGPGIGVGDEIAFSVFLQGLRARFPESCFEVYSFFPGIWRTLVPSVRVRNLVGRPLRAYERIENSLALELAGDLLVVFATFSEQMMFLPFARLRSPSDLVEVSVGRGNLWWLPGDGGAPRRHCELEPELPHQGRALQGLLRHLFGRRFRDPRRREAPRLAPLQSSSPGEPFRLVVNPLTSKRIPLTPGDWAGYVGVVRRALSSSRRLECTIYPGLSLPASGYAAEVGRLCREKGYLAAGDAIRLLARSDGKPLDSSQAIPIVHAAIAAGDLLLGLDTFTAHLAAHTGTPSLTLCLSRNPEFWEEAGNTLWFDLNAAPGVVEELVRLVMEIVNGGSGGPRRSAFDWEHCRALSEWESPSRLVGNVLDLCDLRFRRWTALVDSIWSSLPTPARRLLDRVDAVYAWPGVRNRLGETGLSLRQARQLLAMVSDSVFFRLAVLAGRREAA
ncbi:MAG TPA: hypothetical protein VF173_38240 [Thermoanaerobaculia bacterium]|nr:hypothetical protein [Thermoanaerobaculia bacterium]